jgi:hypothetical protein
MLQACMLIRIAAEKERIAADDESIIPALMPMLDYESDHAIPIVAIEAVLCLVSQPNSVHRVCT